MNKAECNVVRDLMPLCIDGAVSEESQRLVEAHTADCSECAGVYSEMCRALPVMETKKDKDALEHAAKNLRFKRKIRALWAIILGMAALMIALVANAAQVAQFVDDTWFQLRYVGPDNQLRLDAFNAELLIDGGTYLEVESSPCGNRPFRPEFSVRYDEMTGQAYLQMRLISSTEEIGRYHVGSEEVLSRNLYGFAIHDFSYVIGYDGTKMYYMIRDDDYNLLDRVEIHSIELVCGADKQVLWRLGESFPAVWKNGALTKSDAPLPTVVPSPTSWRWTVTVTPTPAPPTEESPRLPQRKR